MTKRRFRRKRGRLKAWVKAICGTNSLAFAEGWNNYLTTGAVLHPSFDDESEFIGTQYYSTEELLIRLGL